MAPSPPSQYPLLRELQRSLGDGGDRTRPRGTDDDGVQPGRLAAAEFCGTPAGVRNGSPRPLTVSATGASALAMVPACYVGRPVTDYTRTPAYSTRWYL